VALHACDTATDQALIQGIGRNASLILVAPCCHLNLNQQLTKHIKATNSEMTSQEHQGFSDAFALVRYDNVFRQQTADMLTDWFRAHILRMAGYRVEIVEFVPSKHSGKNLLIRAIKRPVEVEGSQDVIVKEYNQMKEKWNVVPHLEILMKDHQLSRISRIWEKNSL
ncbi:hypothetical protein AAMO2058_001150300, partial [Amorphochlora amoebiformis]